MKKLAILILVGVVFMGCSPMFYEHDTLYRDWDHLTFSWYRYKQPTSADLQRSTDQGWWGEPIPYVPAE